MRAMVMVRRRAVRLGVAGILGAGVGLAVASTALAVISTGAPSPVVQSGSSHTAKLDTRHAVVITNSGSAAGSPSSVLSGSGPRQRPSVVWVTGHGDETMSPSAVSK